LGFSHGAWAGPLANGTVPDCQTSITGGDSGTMNTCHSTVNVGGFPAGGSASVTEVDITTYPPVPGAKFFGMAVDVTVSDADLNDVPALIEVCFPDPTGMGLIYRWWTASDWQTYYNTVEPAKWVLSPTYYKAGGLTCTQSWLPGVFTIIY
jgi:hypothetical protein